MLAYLFWHRPAEGVDPDAYEQAQIRLHRSLAARPPEGFRGSTLYRAEALSWLVPGAGVGYEDWYVVDDWAAIGVLRQAAIGRGHRTAHASAARHTGAGVGGIYRLLEGEPRSMSANLAIWVSAVVGHAEQEVEALLLGDGADHTCDGLWRRELGLGPAPEYCLLVQVAPAGVGPERLPQQWQAQSMKRERLYPEPREEGR
jgi:hypothetical protein